MIERVETVVERDDVEAVPPQDDGQAFPCDRVVLDYHDRLRRPWCGRHCASPLSRLNAATVRCLADHRAAGRPGKC